MAEANPWSWCCKGNSLSNEDIFMILQLNDSLSVRYPATNTGKGKKLSGSVFYLVIQKKILRVGGIKS